ncbi:MAG: Superoxide dismutase [Clostridia bacterium]|jgi:Fe-Mn family superoxide dismutase|nr:Superoxide dismutase [Clostridia bacterium]
MKAILPLVLMTLATHINQSPSSVSKVLPLTRSSHSGPFVLPPLDYAYDALEPYIDERTMRIHHDRHHRAYVNNLNRALSNYPELYNYSLEELLSSTNLLPPDILTTVMNNAGGDYNHTFFWKIMGPDQGGEPIGNLSTAITRDFGSFDNFKDQFKQAALNVFGSGWTWLLKDSSGRLQIASTPNQNTPIPLGLMPIIAIDVWEHAYYLKHQNERDKYIDDWFNVVNWNYAEELYNN